jgi:hypothetical protein
MARRPPTVLHHWERNRRQRRALVWGCAIRRTTREAAAQLDDNPPVWPSAPTGWDEAAGQLLAALRVIDAEIEDEDLAEEVELELVAAERAAAGRAAVVAPRPAYIDRAPPRRPAPLALLTPITPVGPPRRGSLPRPRTAGVRQPRSA